MSMQNAPPCATLLSDQETETLRALAGWIIPASVSLGVPGGDDEHIFADLLFSIGRDIGALRKAIAQVDALAQGQFDTSDATRKAGISSTLLSRHPASAHLLSSLVARCYYRDDRVMRSIGMQVRAPFPVGFSVKAGDWSLLEPVRARSKVYRDA